MATWFSGDVSSNGIRLHYYRTGGDKPPVVLSHGATDDGLCWTRVTRALESDYDVIMPDARGHGLSDAPAEGYSGADHAADLAGLIAALGLERPALAGHSMGAATTLRLIAESPDLARCAILEDPPLRMADWPSTASANQNPREAMRRMVAEAKTIGREAVMSRGRKASPGWAEEEFGPWADAKVRCTSHLFDGPPVGGAQEWRQLLPHITCGVLLVTADPELGAIVTPEVADEARRLMPGLQVVRLRAAGHNVRREQFEPLVAALRDFLKR